MATVEQDLTEPRVSDTLEKNLTVVGGGQAESFEDAFAAWIAWMEYRDLSPNTIKLYSRTIEIAHTDLGDLRGLDEEALNAWLQKKGGKAGTVGNRICALVSFYRFLVKTKRQLVNPALELERPKSHKRLPKPILDIPAVLDALDELDKTANEVGSTPRRVGESRDMAVFLFYTGLRIHEAVKCDWPVPCPEEALIIGKGNKEEVLQILEPARQAWDRIGKWPIGARATQRRFEKVTTERVTPHKWRHSLATYLVKEGVEIGRVSKIMRHSSPAVTMTYAAYASEQNREALEGLPKF